MEVVIAPQKVEWTDFGVLALNRVRDVAVVDKGWIAEAPGAALAEPLLMHFEAFDCLLKQE